MNETIRNKVLIIIAIIALTFILYANLCWALFMLLASGYFAFLLLRKYPERKTTLAILAMALLLRVVVMLANVVSSACLRPDWAEDILGDATGHMCNGIYIAQIATGKKIAEVPQVTYYWQEHRGKAPDIAAYQVSALSYLQALIYASYGYSPLVIKLINSLAIIFIGLLIYIFLRARHGPGCARLALIAILFLPSLVVWSASGLREGLLIAITLYFLITLGMMLDGSTKINKVISIVLSYIPLFWFSYNLRGRVLLFYAVVAAISIFMFLFMRIKHKYSKRILTVLITAIAIFYLFGFKNARPLDLEWLIYRNSFEIHKGHVSLSYPKTIYKFYPERFYRDGYYSRMSQAEKLQTSSKAVGYYLFAPFFWDLRLSKFLLLAYPQSLFLLLILPFAIMGILHALREHHLSFIPLTLFFIIYTFIASHMTANIGTVFRQRDVITIIYLIFASIGFSCKFYQNIGKVR